MEVGITGGIGCGKTLVSRIFHTLGVPVYDADSRARALMTSDPVVVQLVKENFGVATYRVDGTLDRSALSRQTFGHPANLEKLNNIVHPRVRIDYEGWLKGQAHHPYVLREAALLYEAGVADRLGKVIVVSAPEDLRIRRIQSRDPHRSLEDIRAIMQSQWSEEEKLRRADFVIVNDNAHLVIPQVLDVHKKISELS